MTRLLTPFPSLSRSLPVFGRAPLASIHTLHPQSARVLQYSPASLWLSPEATRRSMMIQLANKAKQAHAGENVGLNGLARWGRGTASSAVEEKYKEKLEKKARSEGLSSVEELKDRALSDPENLQRARLKPLGKPAQEDTKFGEGEDGGKEAKKNTADDGSGAAGKEKKTSSRPGAGGRKEKVPIKPLSSILAPESLLSPNSPPLTTSQLSALWTAYHSQKGILNAVIPEKVYREMERVGKKWPVFVVPVVRGVGGEEEGVEEKASEEKPEGGKGVGVEMHYLQWSFHPNPSPFPTSLADSTTSPSAPSPNPLSTILFTPLSHFRQHQAFSQPHLVLTHYTDLIDRFGVVLMRGEITKSDSGSGVEALTKEEAQQLVLRLQEFYWAGGVEIGMPLTGGEKASTSSTSPKPTDTSSSTGINGIDVSEFRGDGISGSGGIPVQDEKKKEEMKKKREMLRSFHEKPDEFDVDGLVKVAY